VVDKVFGKLVNWSSPRERARQKEEEKRVLTNSKEFDKILKLVFEN